jgi:hypothetical protein
MTLSLIGSVAKDTTQGALFRLVLVVLIGGLTGFYVFLAEREVPPWDPSSMVILAKLMGQERSIQYQDVHNAQIGPYFNPHGFDIRSPGDPHPYSTFPPGFSLILAPVYLLGGLPLLPLVSPLLSSIGLAAAACLGRVIAGRWGALFSVLLIGTSRVVVTFATSLWSDGPSLVLLLLGLAFYLAAHTTGRRAWLLCSGAVLGLMISLKFINIAFAGLVVVHQLIFVQGRPRWDGALRLCGAMLPGLLILFAYQTRAYGGPFASPYQAWGRSLYDFPLFSAKYLFVKAPPPWDDISSRAIASGMLRDMHVWVGAVLIGIVARPRSSYKLLLLLVAALDIALYSVSVFTPRQFINMRYLLPALAASYLLGALALAWAIQRIRRTAGRLLLAGAICAICFGQLLLTVRPDLTLRNTGTAKTIETVLGTARNLPDESVVLAYATADTFILYGHVSVLNYRRVDAPDLASRNQLVLDAVGELLAEGTPVYLVRDDDQLFASIYPELARRFLLRQLATPLTAYEIHLQTEGN